MKESQPQAFFFTSAQGCDRMKFLEYYRTTVRAIIYKLRPIGETSQDWMACQRGTEANHPNKDAMRTLEGLSKIGRAHV